MKFIAIAIAVLATTASAQSKPPPRAVVEAKVVLIDPVPMAVYCGRIMTTQKVVLEVTKVVSGPVKPGRIVLDVMTCFGGPLLHQIDGEPDGLFELDPDALRVGSRIRVDVENVVPGERAWFATTAQITVTKR